jgi:trafficking protein particle complex subunit 3
MGCRLIEDFLAKTGVGSCSDFRDTMDVVAKVSLLFARLARNWTSLLSPSTKTRRTNNKGAFKIFLGISPTVDKWSYDGKECSLVFDENPLAEFVELPEGAATTLWYSNMYCGVLKGALEMVQLEVEAVFVSDVLRGDDTTEIRVKFIKHLDEAGPMSDE